MDGVRVEETEPWRQGSETRRVLRAYFPGSIETHSLIQDFFFDRARRLRRRVSPRHGLTDRVRSVTGKCIIRPLTSRSGLLSSSAAVIGAYLSSQTVARSWLT